MSDVCLALLAKSFLFTLPFVIKVILFLFDNSSWSDSKVGLGDYAAVHNSFPIQG